jgi:hypothetical protein
MENLNFLAESNRVSFGPKEAASAFDILLPAFVHEEISLRSSNQTDGPNLYISNTGDEITLSTRRGKSVIIKRDTLDKLKVENFYQAGTLFSFIGQASKIPDQTKVAFPHLEILVKDSGRVTSISGWYSTSLRGAPAVFRIGGPLLNLNVR